MERPYRDRDWLYRKYHGQGMTQQEIAEECEVHPSTICNYMKEFEINTRAVEGKNHGLYGKERSQEVKQKISDSLQGREITEEARQSIAEAQKGRPTPPEVKEKISRSLTGHTRPLSTREKMSQSTAGEQNPNWEGGYSQ